MGRAGAAALPPVAPPAVAANLDDALDSTPAAPVTVSGIASGTRWMSVGQGVTQVSRLVVSILLARWLSPDAFGVVAVAMTTVLALDVLKGLGTGMAIIQRRTVDEALLTSVFLLNIATAALAAACMFFGAPVIAGLFAAPEAVPVVRAFAVVPLIGGFTQVHHALLRRTMRFASVAKIELTGALVTGTVSIALAIAGLEVWAIVWGNIIGFTAGSVVVWLVSGWRPKARPSLSALRSIAGFSLHTAGDAGFTFVRQNLDKFLVGRWLGVSSLGIYTLGQRTVSYPVLSLTNVLMTVLFPAFSRLQDDNDALRRGYTRALGAIAFVTMPLLIGTAVVAEPFVNALLGDKWARLIPLLWFMAPAGAIQSLLSGVSTLYSAKGRADWLMWWGIASGVASLAAYAIGLQWGLIGLAVAYLAVNLILLPFGLAIPLRLIGLPLKQLVRSLVPYAGMTLVMAVAAGAAVYGLESLGRGPLPQLLTGAGVGVVVYTTLAAIIRPPAWRDVMTVVTRRGAR